MLRFNTSDKKTNFVLNAIFAQMDKGDFAYKVQTATGEWFDVYSWRLGPRMRGQLAFSLRRDSFGEFVFVSVLTQDALTPKQMLEEIEKEMEKSN